MCQENVIKPIDFDIPSLHSMAKYPNQLSYKGNIELLNSPKISIVGTRKPSQYAKNMTYNIASKLSNMGYVIVSGGAMGIDAIAHNGAILSTSNLSNNINTIMVSPTGLNIKYPAVNNKLIDKIDKYGLRISQFEDDFRATSWSFVLRNEIVVALSDILIVSEADINSGTIRSVEYALKMGKKIYTLPHRIGESKGTNKLLEEGKAEVIYDIDSFIASLENNDKKSNNSSKIKKSKNSDDELLEFCSSNPTFDEVLARFGSLIYEYELMGKIQIKDNRVFAL
jgi:DNA processing protein